MTGTQTFQSPATSRPAATDPASAALQRASDTVRRHRYELFILAGTVAFVLIVAVLSLAALTG
jgi:hypothetical protein